MADHRERFERWRKRLPPRTSYLIDRVLDQVVPECAARGIVWHGDYAGGNPQEVAASTIPLQRRAGPDWPTIELQFSNRTHPFFKVYFGVLPPVCRRLGLEAVPRERACIVYAPAYFLLCKGRDKTGYDSLFGYRWFTFFPRSRLDVEVAQAVQLLPIVFDLVDRGIPDAWITHDRGYVDQHVKLAGSWKIYQDLQSRRASDR